MSADGQGTQETHHWFDDEAGPVVRPYAMTRGRTTSAAQHRLDLIAVGGAGPPPPLPAPRPNPAAAPGRGGAAGGGRA
ncbi:hypothetical protein ACFW9D_33365, partial [Streptomyces sp. NPDC059524]